MTSLRDKLHLYLPSSLPQRTGRAIPTFPSFPCVNAHDIVHSKPEQAPSLLFLWDRTEQMRGLLWSIRV